jgi:DNA replication protein DnaC
MVNGGGRRVFVERFGMVEAVPDRTLEIRNLTARGLDRRLRHYTRPTLLCIDEIGYLAYDAHAANLLFQIVTRRYEQKSVVLTTNLAFRDWHTIFPNASCAVGLVDRLTHHAALVKITCESYRLREAERTQKTRRAS